MSAGLTGGQATAALARLAVTRASRGKAIWLAVALTLLPIVAASVGAALGEDADETWWAVFEMTLLILPVVPSVLIASSLSDELEDKTAAYLWSRALPRWSIVVGKLAGLVPICVLIMVTAPTIAWLVMGGAASVPVADLLRTLAGLAGGTVASCTIAAMWATLVPRHAVAVSVVWLLFIDSTLGRLPLKLHYLAASYGARTIPGLTPGFTASALSGVVTLVAIVAVTTLVATARIRRME